MKKKFILFILVGALSMTSCKEKEPEKPDFEKYNNPSFKLSDHPKIQGVFTMAPDKFLQALEINISLGKVCSEFIPEKNVLRMRSGFKGTDLEIKIINVINDELFFSANGNVVKAKLIYKANGELRKYEVFYIGETDPKNSLAWGQGSAAPAGYYEECLKRRDEIMENDRQEAEQLKSMEAM
ncbi:hypothetical protein DLM76_18255 [Leptospira yasudae]|uniref:hypothetical protein n=1 Tax=Leptospira yasudae TaxID=2202201 RepID=UPI000E59EDF8|nr:hypothetical protein [Leptospira yasudae]RHX91111.1 hypothetical protein DLM76_18255 [Leptospira yasudae]